MLALTSSSIEIVLKSISRKTKRNGKLNDQTFIRFLFKKTITVDVNQKLTALGTCSMVLFVGVISIQSNEC
jgi:hypothetical protein